MTLLSFGVPVYRERTAVHVNPDLFSAMCRLQRNVLTSKRRGAIRFSRICMFLIVGRLTYCSVKVSAMHGRG